MRTGGLDGFLSWRKLSSSRIKSLLRRIHFSAARRPPSTIGSIWAETLGLYLDKVLEPVCGSLRDLHLELLAVGFSLDSYELDRENTGEFRAYDTIKTLNRLQYVGTLVIDLMTLAGPFVSDRLDDPAFDLSALLPSNLVRLESKERSTDSTYYYDRDIDTGMFDYGDWLTNLLAAFA
ncbi:hypothetical protein F4677DRAFT_441580 [Hypoxylon crocopeplum]|nr:hypothetical protein F4677DRAFT_441580 [Hypoxylon crocopeplum]